MSPYCWLDLCQQQNHFKIAKPFFLPFFPLYILPTDDAPPYQIWLQKVAKYRRYALPDKTQTQQFQYPHHTPPNFIKGA